MKTTVKGMLAKVVGAGLLAGAVAVAVPAAQAQAVSFGVRVGGPVYGRPVYGGPVPAPAYGFYGRDDRFRDHAFWDRREAIRVEDHRRAEFRERFDRGRDRGWR